MLLLPIVIGAEEADVGVLRLTQVEDLANYVDTEATRLMNEMESNWKKRMP